MTVRNPNPAHKKNILPGLQVPSGLDVELEKYLQAVKEHLQVLQGVLGQPKERAVTLTDLEKAGLATVVVKGGRGEIGSTAAKAGAARAAARQGGATRVRDLSDVDTVGRVDGDLLQYRSTTGKWQRTTVESITSQLAVFDDDNQGVVPASNGGTDNFLRADGKWAEPPGSGSGGSLVYANTEVPAANTVAATDSETAFGSSYTFAEDELEEGHVIRLRLAGVLSTDAAVAPTLRIRVKLGANTLLDTGILALSPNLEDQGWWADATIVVHSVGATGAVEAQGVLQLGGYIIPLDNSATITVDTTSELELTATAQWGASDADDSVTLREMVVFLDGGAGSTLAYVNTSVPAGNTVAETTTETAFDSSYTVPADRLIVGSVVRLHMAGVIGTDAAAGSDIRLRVKIGSTTILDTGSLSLAAGVDDGWWANATIVVHSAGATGAVEAQGVLQLGGYIIPLENSSTHSIDTTGDLELTVTAQWADSDADNTISLRELLVYLEGVDPGDAPRSGTFITTTDQTATMPNSRKLVAGDNITFDTSTDGELEISSAGGGAASDITYDNSTSALEADTVQEAIDELDATLDLLSTPGAEDVTYDNSTSGLDATDVQAAIDELAAEGGGGGGGSVDPLKVYEHFSDMDFRDPTSSGIYYDESVNSGIVAHENGQAGRPGIMYVQKTASGSSGGQANLFWSASPIVLGDGVTEFETEISFDIVNDGGSHRVGLMTGENGTPAEGVFFRNYVTLNDNKWFAECKDSVGSATLNSEFAHGAGEWFKLKLVVNADGSEAEFFINGTSIGTISTNIPTGVPLRWRWQVWQVDGHPASTMKMFVDWVRVKKTLTTPR